LESRYITTVQGKNNKNGAYSESLLNRM